MAAQATKMHDAAPVIIIQGAPSLFPQSMLSLTGVVEQMIVFFIFGIRLLYSHYPLPCALVSFSHVNTFVFHLLD